ncbi:sodium transport system permease protein [Clostridium amylolyticum]|uniref:Sodium transport system permease protein n=1 Tax=Clostridium amylolyticum TaxID=1121298 RepID=A0A1M6IFT3_9CLOT|nr:ABC transporter permease [Clostridium amylolyticum]SHJ33186.1 sodium transport system permease protein [Clostridium amylolyticum]
MNKITFVVLKKELKDMFRDKKTLFVGILIPLLMMPILFGVMGKSVNKSMKSAQENIKIVLQDKGNSNFAKFISKKENIKVVESQKPEEDVKNGKIALSLEIPEDFEKNINDEKISKLKITYDNSTQSSLTAFSIVNSYIEEYSKSVVQQRLDKRQINTELLNPIVPEVITAVKDKEGQGIFMISLLLPLFLVIYSVTGPMAPATDLGAGEKERGTLEPLLSTQAGRLSILWGKFLAITVMGIITTVASLAGVIIAMTQNEGLFGNTSGVNLPIGTILLIALVSILVTMVFGALELAISIYARSFKEAQTYLTPLMVIAFIPAYSTYMTDAKNISTMSFNIPIVNAISLIKEFLVGIYNPVHMLLTFGWIIIYIIASILFARYMFSREEVIFRT